MYQYQILTQTHKMSHDIKNSQTRPSFLHWKRNAMFTSVAELEPNLNCTAPEPTEPHDCLILQQVGESFVNLTTRLVVRVTI
jgi:hypothetical protein